jgi:hypothetical protein
MQRSFTNGKVSYLHVSRFLILFAGRHNHPHSHRFSDADQVAELESTIKSLESQLEEQSSAADNVISEWQESYSALEIRSLESETQLETLRQEKQELSNAERSISVPGQSAAFEELHSQKERLEQELRQLDEALVAARQDLQDAEDAQEWEGESLGLC